MAKILKKNKLFYFFGILLFGFRSIIDFPSVFFAKTLVKTPKKLSVILACFFLSNTALNAQEVLPVYSDYLSDNLYLLHPSMAGAPNMNQLRITARQQWFDVQNRPGLYTANVHGRINDKTGLGAILFNDQNGNFSKTGAYFGAAYHLMFSRSELDLNQLSFGISAGLVQHRLDESNFVRFDPIVGGNRLADIYGNLDVGLSYYYLNFFAHLTAKNLVSAKRDLYFTDEPQSNLRKYLFSTGYVFDEVGDRLSLEPSVLVQAMEATAERSLDLNLKAYYNLNFGQFWGGLSYRYSLEGLEFDPGGNSVTRHNLSYLTPFLGINYGRFMFAYTFTYQTNSIVLSNNGFHQISLGYNFGENRGRYDCKCPAVNY